ncbi:MAG: hypothetical protein JWP63_6577 [Candidatus Solibacter sp.]|nr:hypothetical protein [Candidatus Solibacter sp.]
MQLTLRHSILALAASSLFAQSPAPPKPTHVLATLSLKPGITRDQLTPVMPSEVRDTVNLYLEGKIEQWYSRGDGKGVVFLLNCATVAEARAIVETLPLVKADFASFDYMPLGPLNPLRVLLGNQ